MRASEILRGLADLIAAAEQGSSAGNQMGQSPETPNHAELTAVSVDHQDQTTKGGTFVPPLQAKLELLKKSVNVDNVYDQGGPDEELTGQGDDNEDDAELDQMRKLSGLGGNPTARSEAADDEPLDV